MRDANDPIIACVKNCFRASMDSREVAEAGVDRIQAN